MALLLLYVIVILLQERVWSSKYSSHICMGGDSRLVPEPRVKHECLCHFKNVCYNADTHKFQYYAESVTDEIIRTVQHEFEHSFASDYLWFHLKSVHPEIDVVKESAPSMATHHHDVDDNKLLMLSDDVVMHYSLMHYAYNYLLIDHFYAMWRTLKYFDLYERNASRALFFGYVSRDHMHDYHNYFDNWQSKKTSWDHKRLPPHIALPFMQQVASFIWSQKPLFLSFANETESVTEKDAAFHQVFHDLTQYKLICFDSLAITMGNYVRHWDLSYFIQLFTGTHDPPRAPLVKQSILFLVHNGDGDGDGGARRQYTQDTDLSKLAGYLADLFGVEVQVAYSNEVYLQMTLQQQIQWIAQFTVVIHNGGDDSYLHWFMRERTALITMDWFQPDGAYSVHYDADNLEFEPLKKTFYYFMKQQDMQPANHSHTDRAFDCKNLCRYRLDAPRLARYVYSALLWVEQFNEWQHSFQKPLEIPSL